jgi:transposase
MKDTEFYYQLLGLRSPWRVKTVNMDLAGGEVRIEVECASTTWADEDGNILHIHSYEQREWRHLDTCQLQTIIEARVPRVLNPQTGKTQMVNVPWAAPRSGWTLMFEHFAIRVLEACMTITDAAKLLALNWHQIQRIMERAVERGLLRRKTVPINYVGCDEKSFGRGQDYISVMTDLDHERVLEVVEGRTTQDALGLWESLDEQVRSQIKGVALDFSAGFAAAARQAAPQADIVYDKFHASKLLGEGVDKVRRQEHKILTAQGDDTLKKTRTFWLTGLDNMNDRQFFSFEKLVHLTLKTSRAWEIKELFAYFWDQPTKGEAHKYFTKWYGRTMRSRLEPMKKAAATFKKHQAGLLNYITHPITNALTEGLNSRIQLLKAAARGFRNFKHYRTRILFFLGRLDLLPALS